MRITALSTAAALLAAPLPALASGVDDGWRPVSVVDMTTGDVAIGAEFQLTEGLVEDFALVAFEDVTADRLAPVVAEEAEARRAGWAGLVQVDLSSRDALEPVNAPAFADGLALDEGTTRVAGFYTMRYDFASDAPFRPYAGAGLGLVGASDDATSAGAFAGRAIAGFDLTLADRTALYAEYAYTVAGASLAGTEAERLSLDMPDDEHALTLGFRRTF